MSFSQTEENKRSMATAPDSLDVAAQEILKPHWPSVRNMEENEARQKEVERIIAILKRMPTPGPTERASSLADARTELVGNAGAAGQLSALRDWASHYNGCINAEHNCGICADYAAKAMLEAMAMPQSEPTWPTLKPAEETQALYEAAAPKCNAPNPDGSYLCTNEPGHSGDHVHAFINPDGERDFYFWPIKPVPAPKGKSFYDHIAPDRADIERNKAIEPHGERLRAELEEWLDKNGIVSMRLDTQNHCVSVDIAKLPPEIKSVLGLWGSIYVQREAEPAPTCEASLTGYQLAGCADRAGLVVYTRRRDGHLPMPGDWDNFAAEVCALAASVPPPRSL